MKYDFGDDHPYKSVKFEIFMNKIRDLIKEGQLNIEIVDPGSKFSIDELRKYNSSSFIDHLLKLQKNGGLLDPATPAFPNMVQISSKIAHGTYKQIKNILDNKFSWAFNPVGGYHHGKPNKAAGGCVLNDMGIAINKMRNEGRDEKIAIVDIDYHPHDGTVEFFLNDPSTMCLSIHEAGWFNFDESLSEIYDNIINVPIRSNQLLSDNDYIRIFKDKIVSSLRKFQPDLVILVHGVDGHENDSVTYYGMSNKPISISTKGYAEIDKIICDSVLEICDGRLLGLGAGGYSVKDTVEVWIQAVEIFSDKIN